jgi:probable HAF family extracellular repeat protein
VGIAIDLDPPAGGSRSAQDLNDSAQLVGIHTPSFLDARAFRWSAGTGFVELLGFEEDHRAVGAFGIDSAGVAVGSSGEFSSTKRATRWVAADAPEDLGTLPGDDSSEALAIAEDGSVVGWSNGPTTGQRAIVWTAAEGMRDLNALSDADALGMTLETAQAINAAGQIVGSGRIGSNVHAFLATPVPEAAGGAPACAVLAWLARRRRCARLPTREGR